MRLLLIALSLIALKANAQERWLQMGANVSMVITEIPCESDPKKLIAYAVHVKLNEFVPGCYSIRDKEVFIELQNGDMIQDYRYLEYEFRKAD